MKSLKARTRFSTLRPSLFTLAMFAAPAFALSCSGSVGEAGPGSGTAGASTAPPGSGGSTGTSTGGAGGGSTGGSSAGGGAAGGDLGQSTAESAGVLMMRRLTNREYNNTVRDLLKDTTAPGKSFPLEDASDSGFNTPNEIPALNVQYYGEAAATLASTAIAANPGMIPCTAPATKAAEDTCITQFITDFGRRAYRRPVAVLEAGDLKTVFTTVHGLGASFNDSVGYVIRAMLQSPNFLYHWELGPKTPAQQGGLLALTPHQIASRLSYFLWESMPDDKLLAAADADELQTPEQITAQATRLMGDARFESTLNSFHKQWLNISDLGQLQKDVTIYKTFGDDMKSAMDQELTQFVKAVFAGPATLKELLTAPYTFANSVLAPVYGNSTVKGAAFSKITLDPKQRAGLLTQTAFLAANGKPNTSDPIHRGLTVWRRLLCGDVPPPPPNVPDPPDPTPNTTTRERFALHASSPCASCHVAFDPPGFAFEHYDGIGGYRATESGKQVDSSGTMITPGEATTTFNDAPEMINALAVSTEVQQCVTRQWFRYVAGRLETADDQGSLAAAYKKAQATDGFSLRDLLLQMVQSTAFRFRKPSP